MDVAGAARAVVGAILLAWLPGYVWTRLLVPGLRALERFLFAVGLSVALMVLALYLGNILLEVRVTPVHAVWWALFLTSIPLAVFGFRRVAALMDERLRGEGAPRAAPGDPGRAR